MSAAVITGSFVVAAVGAYWALMGLHADAARGCLRVGVVAGLVACMLQLFPTGDRAGKLVAEHQQPALAAMEGKFASSSRAELAIIGQPDVDARRLENPIEVPYALSFLAYGSFGATVHGLDDIKDLDRPFIAIANIASRPSMITSTGVPHVHPSTDLLASCSAPAWSPASSRMSLSSTPCQSALPTRSPPTWFDTHDNVM
jgi:cytochrome bd-type quinol oxidase subunit 1